MKVKGLHNKKFNVVLVRPEIPQNTGNIGRICVSTGSSLHLIKPLGFSLDDKYVRRAGMDYWKHLDLNVHEDWNAFINFTGKDNLYFFSTKGEKSYWDCPMEGTPYVIFGNESSGLPKEFYKEYADNLYQIPMPGEFCRSMNLANSVALVVYEGLRRYYTLSPQMAQRTAKGYETS